MLLFSLALFAASTAAEQARSMPVINPLQREALCPETPTSLARRLGKRPPRAIPLGQLPPAETFMAIDRRVDGCPAPMTIMEYESGARH